MARWFLPAALAFICAVGTAAAQATRGDRAGSGRPNGPPLSGLNGPATFKTNECVVSILVDSAGASRPIGETTVLIDERHRLTLRLLPRISPGPSFVTFVPHNSLCDGRTHKVELAWKGGRGTYQTTFPNPSSPFLGNPFPRIELPLRIEPPNRR